MKKKNEQKILTMIIIIAVIAIALLIVSIIYEEQIEKNKVAVESIAIPTVKNKEIEEIENKDTMQKQEIQNEEYVGEEEQETANNSDEINQIQSNDEKAIKLAKKEWGEDDSVTFNVEEKKGTKYYVAVKQDGIVISWYEVDTENWKISEY